MTRCRLVSSFVTLATRDHRSASAISCVELGFPISLDIPDNFAAFVIGGIVLALYPDELLAGEAAPGEVAPTGWRGFTLSINVDNREDVDAAYTAAIAAGGTVIMEPVDREYGPARAISPIPKATVGKLRGRTASSSTSEAPSRSFGPT